MQADLPRPENMQANRLKVDTLTWQPHRTKHPRNCDQCPPRHPAAWNLHQPGVVTMYLCDDHASRLAGIYGIEPPPVTGAVPQSTPAR